MKNEFKVYTSRTRMLLALLGCMGFVAIGYFITIINESIAIFGFICLTFFGFGALASLLTLVRPLPLLIANNQGIRYAVSAFNSNFLKWEDIKSIELIKVSDYWNLEIYPKSFEQVISQGLKNHGFYNYPRIKAHQPILLPLASTSVSPEEIKRNIDSFFHANN